MSMSARTYSPTTYVSMSARTYMYSIDIFMSILYRSAHIHKYVYIDINMSMCPGPPGLIPPPLPAGSQGRPTEGSPGHLSPAAAAGAPS